jgi:hypothetical protein
MKTRDRWIIDQRDRAPFKGLSAPTVTPFEAFICKQIDALAAKIEAQVTEQLANDPSPE